MSKLKMRFPQGIEMALRRRHFGREDIRKEEAIEAVSKMNILLVAYRKAEKKYEYVGNEFWEKEKIEDCYGTPKFYGAHRRLKNARKKLEEIHREMFYLMVYTDGNYEQYHAGVMGAEQIAEDFKGKYLKRFSGKV